MPDSSSSDHRESNRRHWTVWIATLGPLGHSPVAPGTVGSLAGIPLALGIAQIPGPWLQAGAIVILCAFGVWVCGAAAERLGTGKDPGMIVFDEVAAMPIALFWIGERNPWVLVAGFALFRLFDVTKPPPVRQAERLGGGLGIMADDWLAGVYANLTLRLFLAIGVLS